MTAGDPYRPPYLGASGPIFQQQAAQAMTDPAIEAVARAMREHANLSVYESERAASAAIAALRGMGMLREGAVEMSEACRAGAQIHASAGLLLNADEWVACADRLPEFYGEYLVWRPGMKHGREAYFAAKCWEMIDDDRRLGEFTHWRPLPAPPAAPKDNA